MDDNGSDRWISQELSVHTIRNTPSQTFISSPQASNPQITLLISVVVDHCVSSTARVNSCTLPVVIRRDMLVTSGFRCTTIAYVDGVRMDMGVRNDLSCNRSARGMPVSH